MHIPTEVNSPNNPNDVEMAMVGTHQVLLLLANFFTVNQTYPETLPPSYHSQKQTHLHFYLHDVVSGKNPTTTMVTLPVAASAAAGSSFGIIVVTDDLMTTGPDPKSSPVGKSQGMYVSSQQQGDTALLMNMNLVFTEGEFNGSTLSLLGRNSILSAVREIPIVGGTGGFRFARGYAQAKTHSFNLTSGNAVVEYNVYVLHYT